MTETTSSQQEHGQAIRVPPMPKAPEPPKVEPVELHPVLIFGDGVRDNSPTFTDFRPLPVDETVIYDDPKDEVIHPSVPPQSPPSTGSQETPETDPGSTAPSATPTLPTVPPQTATGGSSSPSPEGQTTS